MAGVTFGNIGACVTVVFRIPLDWADEGLVLASFWPVAWLCACGELGFT
ncbi:hypothetical protein [Corynebacterium freiburgense]|nr:hypothetical protein [Corynebacterium freiburgense]